MSDADSTVNPPAGATESELRFESWSRMRELNPVLDAENRTGKLGVGLMASVLGKTIL